MKKWTRALYQPNLPLYPSGFVTASKEHIALSRRAAREGAVLLKNENGLLPLDPSTQVAVFGKGCADYVKGGGGSGDVTVAYVHTLLDGMAALDVPVFTPLCDFYRDYVSREYQNGAVPGMMAEPELPEQLLASARAYADTAVIVLSRFSGEGWDRSDVTFVDPQNPWEDENAMPKRAKRLFGGSDWYLSDAEKALIRRICECFPKVAVVLNVGGGIDVSLFADDERISSLLLTYQGGMEGGDAAAELLFGLDNPSGKLPDTLARDLGDYPSTEHFHDSPWYVDYTEDIYMGYRYFETVPGAKERVVYPFGFGLSYTTFELVPVSAFEKDGEIEVAVQVTNTGSRPGREVAELYFEAPQGLIQKPSCVLAAFQKTKLLPPGESETLILRFPVTDMASFDDTGAVEHSAWFMDKGRYQFYLGTSVRDAKRLDYVYELAQTLVTQRVSDALAPSRLSKRLQADGTYEPVPKGADHDPNEDALERMPNGSEEAVAPAARGREKYMLFKPLEGKPLSDVAEGKMTLDEFVSQLSEDDLLHLLGGQPNVSVSNTFGMGNLPEYGVPTVTTADGPAGLRLQPETGLTATAWPCATLLAASWDEELTNAVGAATAAEVKENNISVWLAPAVNLHRSPMCGRNFEYWTEDPLLCGKLAASMVRGIQSQNVAATVKHFACNNKETNRKNSDSRLSQRALRELYLKQFEIIVKEAEPWAIMSSYNIINGRRASESRELLTDILRLDWGYEGLVMTDWWNRGEHYKEILAGNDLKMATGWPERVRDAMKLGLVKREDLKTCAKRVLELILKID